MKYSLKIVLSTIIFLAIGIPSIAQNEYQSQLYFLNDRINLLEKNYIKVGRIDSKFFSDKFELIKAYHRLSEEVQMASIKKMLDSELSDLIEVTTDIACNRLNLLECYLYYNKDRELYKTNLDRSKAIYMSLYLKIKTLEK